MLHVVLTILGSVCAVIVWQGLPADLAYMDRSVLAQLGRKSFCSKTALSNILTELKAACPDANLDDMPTSRTTVKRSRDDSMDLSSAYGALLTTKTILRSDKPDKHDVLDCVNPMTAFSHACATCDEFRYAVTKNVRQKPPSAENPWSIIIYSDEIVAGDPLRHDNKRKCQGVYWTFKELNKRLLSNEYAWFVLSACRSSRVSRLDGGMSAFMKELVLMFFDGPCNIAVHGMAIPNVGIIFGKIGIHVSDEGALKQVMQMKGASGLIPCVICPNTGKDSLAGSPNVVPLHETDICKHTHHSDETLRSTVLMLAAEHETLMSRRQE